MSFFTSAQGFAISGGQFTSTTTSVTMINSDESGTTGIDILREASAPEATYDSSARAYSPRCFPGTRKQYIEDILQWASPAVGDAPAPIYWMRGPAGVGKSAIAQTCAQKLQEQGVLGAAFFFSIDGRDKSETLFPSIAYQLSTIDPAYRDLIDKKIRRDKTLVSKAMAFQFQHLIKDPLQELMADGKGIRKRIVVLIDGLDECEGIDAQCEIISIIAAAASDGALPLCWAFFSRPDPHIEATFSDPTIASQCFQIILPISRDADGEIELYLRNGFKNILRRRNISMQSQWPSAEDMKTIVGAAGGSFIYAITVLRFVGQLDAFGPYKRLQAVVEVILNRRQRDPNSGIRIDTAFAELDAFYTLILRRVPKEIFSSVHLLLALLFRLGSRSVIVAANVLQLSKDEFETVCNHAGSVIRLEHQGKDLELDPTIDTNCSYTKFSQCAVAKISRKLRLDMGGRVSFYHKSFYDFLLDPERSGSYCVKGSEALARHLVKIHLDYDRSFCWIGSELVLAPGVTESASSLSYPYTNELVNSLIKAHVYYHTGAEDSQSFSVAKQGRLEAECDFRKRLHIVAHLVDPRPSSGLRWGCRCRFKWLPGTSLAWISSEDFPKFNVIEFKQMIIQHLEARIIQPYHRDLTSWVKAVFRSLLCIKRRGHIESGLYRIGHGEKSIFWYWEIDYKLRHYREFRTINLVEGERSYLEEDFGLWPEYEESESDSRAESASE